MDHHSNAAIVGWTQILAGRKIENDSAGACRSRNRESGGDITWRDVDSADLGTRY